MHVPANQIDGREWRHRAPGMRPDQVIDKCDAMLRGQLGRSLRTLKPTRLPTKRGPILGDNHLAAEPFGEHREGGFQNRGIGVRDQDHFGADDHVRRIEQMRYRENCGGRNRCGRRPSERWRVPRNRSRRSRQGGDTCRPARRTSFLQRQSPPRAIRKPNQLRRSYGRSRRRRCRARCAPRSLGARASFCTSVKAAELCRGSVPAT